MWQTIKATNKLVYREHGFVCLAQSGVKEEKYKKRWFSRVTSSFHFIGHFERTWKQAVNLYLWVTRSMCTKQMRTNRGRKTKRCKRVIGMQYADQFHNNRKKVDMDKMLCAQTGWLRYCSLRLTASNGESNVPIIRLKCMLCFRICRSLCLLWVAQRKGLQAMKELRREKNAAKLVDCIRCANGRQTTADEAIRYAIHIMMHMRTYIYERCNISRPAC